MSTHLISDRYIGESKYITIAFNRELAAGQSLSSVTWTPESPITEDGGTSAIGTVNNPDGTPGPTNGAASARFTVPGTAVAGNKYTVKCTAITQSPIETLIGWVEFYAKAVPT